MIVFRIMISIAVVGMVLFFVATFLTGIPQVEGNLDNAMRVGIMWLGAGVAGIALYVTWTVE